MRAGRAMMRVVMVCGGAATLAGCTTLRPSACLPPARPMLSAELAFGRNIGDRLGVSDADFKRFAADEITPRFPDGFTVLDGVGQWHDPARDRIVHEKTKLVMLVFAEDPAKAAALTEIADAYKRRFKQQGVLVAMRPSCVSF